MPWARASSLHRYLNCPASCSLPRFERGQWEAGYLANGVVGVPDVYKPRERTGMTYFTTRDGSRGDPLGEAAKEAEWGGAADWGTLLHRAKEGVVPEADSLEHDATTDVYRPVYELMLPHRDKLWPNRLGQHEVTISYDCTTGLVELHNGPKAEADAWKMSRSRACVVGTSDWWASLPTGEPWNDDLKSGWQKPDVLTEQNTFYVMCRRLWLRQEHGERWPLARLSITHWSRRNVEAGPSREWKQISGAMLDEFREEVHVAHRRAVEEPRRAIAGVQCLYCPSALVCTRGTE